MFMLVIILVEVSKHYNSKVSLEHQLPTATQKLKTTDECIVSSLVTLVTTTGKVWWCIFKHASQQLTLILIPNSFETNMNSGESRMLHFFNSFLGKKKIHVCPTLDSLTL